MNLIIIQEFIAGLSISPFHLAHVRQMKKNRCFFFIALMIRMASNIFKTFDQFVKFPAFRFQIFLPLNSLLSDFHIETDLFETLTRPQVRLSGIHNIFVTNRQYLLTLYFFGDFKPCGPLAY
jgi:hypothetical protein